MPLQIRVGKHILGKGNPTFIVAEMSGNHGGTLEGALKVVNAAKKAGADALKLQTYTADTITLKSGSADFLLKKDSPWSKNCDLWSLYNQAYTPWEWHEDIFREARKLNLEVFSSPFDETAVDFLESLNVPAYKIASPEITHIPLLERVASTGKPIILSTGVARSEDIEIALETLINKGSKEIIILKCTSAYPSPLEDSNLITILDIQSRYGVLSGLSDHTIGTTAATVSVAFGASLIEKHLFDDAVGETVDSFFSANQGEFSKMVSAIRAAELCVGSISYEIAPSALQSFNSRRSFYVSRDIAKGEIITKENTKIVRPGHGLHPRYYKEIYGKVALRRLEPGERLSWEVLG
jgi:N-acetylneuraminate synthase/pseudaminic acid synthase